MTESGKQYTDELNEVEELMQDINDDNMEDFFAFISLLDVAKSAGILVVDTSTFYH